MQNMHDVFAAICADEGDHVHTMTACLDTEANLQSPSVERKVLTGIALVAVASYLVSSTGMLDGSILDSAGDILDSAGVASDAAAAIDATSIFEVIAAGVAGLAGFAEQFINDEEARGLASLSTDSYLVEGGALEQLWDKVVEFFVKVL